MPWEKVLASRIAGTHDVNVAIKAMAWSSQNLLAVLLDSGAVQILNIQGGVTQQFFLPDLARACGSMDWIRRIVVYSLYLNKVLGCTPGNEEAVGEVINLDQFYSAQSKYLVANLVKSSASMPFLRYPRTT